MGDLFIDVETKGFTDMTALSSAQSSASAVDKKAFSPALTNLLDALKKQGASGKPTEVVIGVFGEDRHVFTVELNDLREIQEILEWTIGQ